MANEQLSSRSISNRDWFEASKELHLYGYLVGADDQKEVTTGVQWNPAQESTSILIEAYRP